MNWQKYFKLSLLEKLSDAENVDCPFGEDVEGPIIYNVGRRNTEHLCEKLCGVIFKNEYKPMTCPCEHLNSSYVKKKFWKNVLVHR